MAKKLSKKDKKDLKEATDEFIQAMKEKISVYLMHEDIDAIDRLIQQNEILSGYEVIRAIREKGLSKEIMALRDKEGGLNN